MSLPRASLSAPAAQAGLTLIELMVSIAIGLVISLAAALTYLNTADAGRVAEATGRMNEDAQAALIMLTQQLRMAGSNPIQPDRAPNSRQNPLTNPFAFRGCDSTFSNVTTATSTSARLPTVTLTWSSIAAYSSPPARPSTPPTAPAAIPGPCADRSGRTTGTGFSRSAG